MKSERFSRFHSVEIKFSSTHTPYNVGSTDWDGVIKIQSTLDISVSSAHESFYNRCSHVQFCEI